MRWRWPEWVARVYAGFGAEKYSSEELRELKLFQIIYSKEHHASNSSWFEFDESRFAPVREFDPEEFLRYYFFDNTLGDSIVSEAIQDLIFTIHKLAEKHIDSKGKSYINDPYMLFLGELREWLIAISTQPVEQDQYNNITRKIAYLINLSAEDSFDLAWRTEIQRLVRQLEKVKIKLAAVLFSESAVKQLTTLVVLSTRSLQEMGWYIHLMYSMRAVLVPPKISKEQISCGSSKEFESSFLFLCNSYDNILTNLYLAKERIELLARASNIAEIGGNVLVYAVLTGELSAVLYDYERVIDSLIHDFTETESAMIENYEKYLLGTLKLSSGSQWPENYKRAINFEQTPTESLLFLKERIARIITALLKQKYSSYQYWNSIRQYILAFQQDVKSLFHVEEPISKATLLFPPDLIADKIMTQRGTLKRPGTASDSYTDPEFSYEYEETSEDTRFYPTATSTGYRNRPMMGTSTVLVTLVLLTPTVMAIEPVTMAAILLGSYLITSTGEYVYSTIQIQADPWCYTDDMHYEAKSIRNAYRSYNLKPVHPMRFFESSVYEELEFTKKAPKFRSMMTTGGYTSVTGSECVYFSNIEIQDDGQWKAKPIIEATNSFEVIVRELVNKIEAKVSHFILDKGFYASDPYIHFLTEMRLWAVAKAQNVQISQYTISAIKAECDRRLDYINDIRNFDSKRIRKKHHAIITNFNVETLKPGLKDMTEMLDILVEKSSLLSELDETMKKTDVYLEVLQKSLVYLYQDQSAGLLDENDRVSHIKEEVKRAIQSYFPALPEPPMGYKQIIEEPADFVPHLKPLVSYFITGVFRGASENRFENKQDCAEAYFWISHHCTELLPGELKGMKDLRADIIKEGEQLFFDEDRRQNLRKTILGFKKLIENSANYFKILLECAEKEDDLTLGSNRRADIIYHKNYEGFKKFLRANSVNISEYKTIEEHPILKSLNSLLNKIHKVPDHYSICSKVRGLSHKTRQLLIARGSLDERCLEDNPTTRESSEGPGSTFFPTAEAIELVGSMDVLKIYSDLYFDSRLAQVVWNDSENSIRFSRSLGSLPKLISFISRSSGVLSSKRSISSEPKNRVSDVLRCDLVSREQLQCYLPFSSRIRLVSKLPVQARQIEHPENDYSDRYDFCEFSSDKGRQVYHCVGQHTEFIEYDPTEENGLQPSIFTHFANTVLHGALYSAFPEAVGDTLYITGLLSKRNSEYSKTATNLIMMLFTTSYLTVLLQWMFVNFLMQIGFSQSHSRAAGNALAFAISLGNKVTPQGFAMTATHYCAGRVGLWAEKSLVKSCVKCDSERDSEIVDANRLSS